MKINMKIKKTTNPVKIKFQKPIEEIKQPLVSKTALVYEVSKLMAYNNYDYCKIDFKSLFSYYAKKFSNLSVAALMTCYRTLTGYGYRGI